MTRAQATARRDNAPIRKRRPATTVPDLLVSVAGAAFFMGLSLFIASFVSEDNVGGATGVTLARLFAGVLAIVSVLLFTLARVLLRDERANPDRYIVPIAVGAIAGILFAILILGEAESAVALPSVLFIFALRPVRKLLARLAGRGGAR